MSFWRVDADDSRFIARYQNDVRHWCDELRAQCRRSTGASEFAKQPLASAGTSDVLLRKFLQSYLKGSVFGEDKTVRFSSASVDLDGDRVSEIVVYVSGQDWCGTGGCLLLVLKSKATSYEVVGRTSITRLPIRVLASETNAWRDL